MRIAITALALLAACGDKPTDETADDTTAEVSDDPWATAPAESGLNSYAPANYKAAAPKRIIFLGDSITEGQGATRDALAYTQLLMANADSQWPGFEEADLEAAWDEAPEVIDVSMGGATTDTLFNNQLPQLEGELEFPAAGETIVVFTIGGNDLQRALLPGSNASSVANQALENFGDILGWLQNPSRFPDGVFIYATNVYEPTDGVGQTPGCFMGIDFSDKMETFDNFNADLRALGESEGVAILDLRGHFLGHGFHADADTLDAYDAEDPTEWFASDCIHPNNRGHHEVRRLFDAAIRGWPLRHVLPQ